MTIRETIKQLQAQGHSITYYERKDGGVLITSIDGTKFTGANGNKVARWMTSQELSEKRARQLESATKRRTTGSKKVDTLLRKVQRKWTKRFGKNPEVGKKTFRKTQWRLENKGEEETIRSLLESESYAEGFAYTENIRQLVEEMRKVANAYDVEELHDIADWIENNQQVIREEWIFPIYQQLYDFDKLNRVGLLDDIAIKNICSNIKRILNMND